MKRFTIVGIGEALFDLLPDGEILGGAPLNVMVHAHQLAASLGVEAAMVSRAAADERGQRLRDELAGRGVSTNYIQTDPERPTGTVRVALEQGEPRFDIVRDVAWDRLEFTPDLPALAAECNALCFGSLGQRDMTAHRTICRFIESAPRAMKLFDVNLRQPYYCEALLRRGFELASFAKMNEDELLVVAAALRLTAPAASGGREQLDELAESLRSQFQLGGVILARGARGATLYLEDGQLDAPPARYVPQANADRVGAGDAFSAALLVGMVLDWPPMTTLMLANRMGAFVASVCGATPALPPEILAQVRE